ncbi:ATP12 ATPase family protein [Zalerion maritima]|uniref:ATP12 ATPase family protein n=1 Tax=Zalerion maritima TaxID=339359 RepID=A0AAD5RSL2_9PEZI|nr:ATP12 ATPase family protein [Zalerion maritima]
MPPISQVKLPAVTVHIDIRVTIKRCPGAREPSLESGKEEVKYPFAFKKLDWDQYHRFRPGYPSSMWDMWLDYAGERGCGFGLAHDLGAAMQGKTTCFSSQSYLQPPAKFSFEHSPAEKCAEWIQPLESVDFASVGMAFHYFRPKMAVEAIRKTLVPGTGVFCAVTHGFRLQFEGEKGRRLEELWYDVTNGETRRIITTGGLFPAAVTGMARAMGGLDFVELKEEGWKDVRRVYINCGGGGNNGQEENEERDRPFALLDDEPGVIEIPESKVGKGDVIVRIDGDEDRDWGRTVGVEWLKGFLMSSQVGYGDETWSLEGWKELERIVDVELDGEPPTRIPNLQLRLNFSPSFLSFTTRSGPGALLLPSSSIRYAAAFSSEAAPPTTTATRSICHSNSHSHSQCSPYNSTLRSSGYSGRRTIHSTAPAQRADTLPIHIIGPAPPPPEPPSMSTSTPTKGQEKGGENAEMKLEKVRMRLERRKRFKELMEEIKGTDGGGKGQEKKAKPGTGGRRRFWKDTSVREVDALRHPATKETIRAPSSKPHLAAALAMEWDALTSATDATKQHLIPLTSLVCRAMDIQKDDVSRSPTLRAEVTDMALKYLDTDTLLCWAEPPRDGEKGVMRNEQGECLAEVQERVAGEVVAWLTKRVWKGVVGFKPALRDGSIFPVPQTEEVKGVVGAWVWGLDAWELAGLERGVLAGKSVLVAARLVGGWSEGGNGVRVEEGQHGNVFGVEEAARAASIEVDWQTGNWGEVEDTHDVEKEDVRRQFGSVVLLVSGTGTGTRTGTGE